MVSNDLVYLELHIIDLLSDGYTFMSYISQHNSSLLSSKSDAINMLGHLPRHPDGMVKSSSKSTGSTPNRNWQDPVSKFGSIARATPHRSAKNR